MVDSQGTGESHAKDRGTTPDKAKEDCPTSGGHKPSEGKKRVFDRSKANPQQLLYSRSSGEDRRENVLRGECKWCLERDRCSDGTICRSEYKKYLRMCDRIRQSLMEH